MAQQQIPAGQPAVLTQAVPPPAYESLPADVQKQQPPTVAPQQVPVQQLIPQGVPIQAWPQGQVYQQPAPVQYIAVSNRMPDRIIYDVIIAAVAG